MAKKALALLTSGILIVGCASTTSSSRQQMRCCCPDHSRCACESCNPSAKDAVKPADATKPAADAMKLTPTSAAFKVYPIAPPEMVKRLEHLLAAEGFAVTSENGSIQTSWKSYEGEFHIFRRWQEQSRYRIVVIPDVYKPTEASRIEVSEQTQRRSNDKAAWEDIKRPSRAEELRKSLDAKLSSN